MYNFLNPHILNSGPPEHTRLRPLVNLSFTARLVDQWHERIQAITTERLKEQRKITTETSTIARPYYTIRHDIIHELTTRLCKTTLR